MSFKPFAPLLPPPPSFPHAAYTQKYRMVVMKSNFIDLHFLLKLLNLAHLVTILATDVVPHRYEFK